MNINDWHQSGRISLWRYKGNPSSFKGYHLTCSADGGTSLNQLIDLLINSEIESKRTIVLSAPTKIDLLVPNCKAKAIPLKKLQISNNLSDADAWLLKNEENKVILSLGCNMLNKLKNGIADISEGKGDYSIGIKNDCMWFWW